MATARPSAPSRAYIALVRHEARLALRRGENAVVTIGLPAAVLVFLAFVPLGPPSASGFDGMVARVVATGIVATGLVSLGIATAFERTDGFVRRLTLTPAPRWSIVAAKATVVAATVAVQYGLLVAIGALLGWRQAIGPLVEALPAVALGTLAHASAGLLLAFVLRAEAVLAVANALLVVLLLGGGLVVPASSLPPPVSTVAGVLPPGLLARSLEGSFGGVPQPTALVGLALWSIGLTMLAVASVRTSE